MSAEHTLKDATGRPIRVGTRVGGVTSGRYQHEVWGRAVRLGKVKITMKVDTPTPYGSFAPKQGDEILLAAHRLFVLPDDEGNGGDR